VVASSRLIARAGSGLGNDEARLLIRAATRYLELATGWVFGEPRTVTSYLRGKGGGRLWLPGEPYLADGGPAVTEQLGSESPRGITDFVVRGASLVRTWPALWARGYEYAVTYKAGYLIGTGPILEQEAVLQYALELWRQSSPLVVAVASGVTGETLEDYSWTADSAGLVLERVPQAMLDVINLRRRYAL
jgi:hypothetical protein